jgi:hypothetical protein
MPTDRKNISGSSRDRLNRTALLALPPLSRVHRVRADFYALSSSKSQPEWLHESVKRRPDVAVAAMAMARTIWAPAAHERAYQTGVRESVHFGLYPRLMDS